MPIEARTRRRVNLSIHQDVIDDAKALSLNASRAAEEGIARAVKAERERQWLEANADAIAARKERLAREGLLLTPHWLDANE